VVVTDHSAAGETWDPLGGLPDPMVCATNLSGQTGCTAPCQDQTTCVPVPGLVMNGSSPLILTGYELVNGFTLQVLDSDAAYNDVIWTGTLTPNSLSSGSAQPGDTLVSLSWLPQPYGT